MPSFNFAHRIKERIRENNTNFPKLTLFHGLKSEKEIKTEVEPIGKMSKSMTLHVTVEYLNYLTDEIRNQQKEIKRLENKKKILSSLDGLPYF